MDALTVILTICGIVSFIATALGAVFRYVIISPLRSTIDNLSDTVDKFSREIEESRRDRQTLNIKVATIETHIENIIHRLDVLEK